MRHNTREKLQMFVGKKTIASCSQHFRRSSPHKCKIPLSILFAIHHTVLLPPAPTSQTAAAISSFLLREATFSAALLEQWRSSILHQVTASKQHIVNISRQSKHQQFSRYKQSLQAASEAWLIYVSSRKYWRWKHRLWVGKRMTNRTAR